jgi:hypothetical protein
MNAQQATAAPAHAEAEEAASLKAVLICHAMRALQIRSH